MRLYGAWPGQDDQPKEEQGCHWTGAAKDHERNLHDRLRSGTLQPASSDPGFLHPTEYKMMNPQPFTKAQNKTYAGALAELLAGSKQGHFASWAAGPMS